MVSASLRTNDCSQAELQNIMVDNNSARLTFDVSSLRAEGSYEVEVSVRPRGQHCSMTTNSGVITGKF